MKAIERYEAWRNMNPFPHQDLNTDAGWAWLESGAGWAWFVSLSDEDGHKILDSFM